MTGVLLEYAPHEVRPTLLKHRDSRVLLFFLKRRKLQDCEL